MAVSFVNQVFFMHEFAHVVVCLHFIGRVVKATQNHFDDGRFTLTEGYEAKKQWDRCDAIESDSSVHRAPN